jgi:hypothetical protein
MFNLEQSIAEWRRQMLAIGIKTPVPLEELESHLREDVEERMHSGSSAPQAFASAVQQIGHASSLKQEFAKVGGTIQTRIKHIILTLSGVPNLQLATNMNTSNSNIEPGWATYLRAAVFIAPAVCLWGFALIYCMPEFKLLSERAGGGMLPEFARINLGIAEFIKNHLVRGAGAVVLALGLLEWRARQWPRYRRATMGLTAFMLNFAFIISLFLIIATAAVVAGMAINALK